VPFFIPSNVGVGGVVPSTNLGGGPVGACTINGTASQSFNFQSRTVSHLQVAFPLEGFPSVSCNAYWDQATGVLTQVIYSYSNQTGDTATNWSANVKLIETSLFTVSNSPSPSIPELNFPALIAVALATAAIVAISKRKGRTN
jgi:hypothetical protein